MYKKRKRWLAWMMIITLAVSAIAPQTAAAAEVENDTVLLEGIQLNTKSLVMKTGDQKTLTATLLPENTTEEPEILWSSDDPSVAEVIGEGNSAVVKAPEGGGGHRTGADAREPGIYAE